MSKIKMLNHSSKYCISTFFQQRVMGKYEVIFFPPATNFDQVLLNLSLYAGLEDASMKDLQNKISLQNKGSLSLLNLKRGYWTAGRNFFVKLIAVWIFKEYQIKIKIKKT